MEVPSIPFSNFPDPPNGMSKVDMPECAVPSFLIVAQVTGAVMPNKSFAFY